MKVQNEDLKKRIKALEHKNDQMTLKIEQSFTSNTQNDTFAKSTLAMPNPQPGSAMASMNHMNSQTKYNSIDIGYDEINFDSNLNRNNSKTNTNISSKKKIL